MRPLILADNQGITCAGVLYLCDKMPGFILDSSREVSDRKELIRALTIRPEAVVVLDYTLFDLSGVDELLILQARFKQAWWILFSDELSEDFIRRVLFGGDTFSIVLKDDTLDEIGEAFRKAELSERYVCQRINNLLAHRRKESESRELLLLTPTERDIVRLIASGKTTKEIAAERFSSIHTVMTHRKNIFRKLEINNVYEATKYALRAGIIDQAEYYI